MACATTPPNARYGGVGLVPRHQHLGKWWRAMPRHHYASNSGVKLMPWRIRATKPKIAALPMGYFVLVVAHSHMSVLYVHTTFVLFKNLKLGCSLPFDHHLIFNTTSNIVLHFTS
jgi:hypothetical protein